MDKMDSASARNCLGLQLAKTPLGIATAPSLAESRHVGKSRRRTRNRVAARAIAFNAKFCRAIQLICTATTIIGTGCTASSLTVTGLLLLCVWPPGSALKPSWPVTTGREQLACSCQTSPMSYGRPCDGAIISSSQLILLRMVGQGKNEAGVARAMWQGGRIAGASCANLRWE